MESASNKVDSAISGVTIELLAGDKEMAEVINRLLEQAQRLPAPSAAVAPQTAASK